MQPPKLTYDNKELIIKNEAWINLILGFPGIALLAIAIFFGKGTKHFFKENPSLIVAFTLVILVVLFFLVRNSLDSRIKMVINSQGIWVSKKGLLAWEDIQYYYFEEIRGDGEDTSILKIKLNDSSKEVKVVTNFFNISEEDIEAAIKRNCGEHNIIALKEYY